MEMDLKQILELHKKWLNNEAGGKRANLRSADLSGANLSGADLRGAYLRGADLRGANLRSADLSDANLWGADLRGANLSDANLRSADLCGADLRDAYLWGADLHSAGLWNTIGNQVEVLTFQTNKYTVVICQDRLQIGCKNFSQSDWFNFSDDKISEMDSGALDWWCTHKQHVKTWCEMVNSYSK
jgi:uncharacterized protein YjbI with pentapeptide repeats